MSQPYSPDVKSHRSPGEYRNQLGTGLLCPLNSDLKSGDSFRERNGQKLNVEGPSVDTELCEQLQGNTAREHLETTLRVPHI